MSFSQDTDVFEQGPNVLAQNLLQVEAQGKKIINLIASLPGREGPLFPQARLQEIYARSLTRASLYHPNSMGQEVARVAISDFYQERGLSIPADQILLTAGSSLSYLYLFRLLADPGEEILCPCPSYPLFEHLARLGHVSLRDYPLRETENFPYWRLDVEELENRVTTKTKAIVLISPHNPTGLVISQTDLAEIAAIAKRHKLAIIQDEVFSEFVWTESTLPRVALTQAPLVFTLNGMSKMLSLPGLKLSWILMSGDPDLVKSSKQRLELISDLFLPVHEPIQFALPEILEEERTHLSKLRTFAQSGLEIATKILGSCKNWSLCQPQAGFYLPLRANNRDLDADSLAVSLLQERGILVHPGSFYDLERSHLVLSFLHESGILRENLPLLKNFLDAAR